jgi:hypothetical protein
VLDNAATASARFDGRGRAARAKEQVAVQRGEQIWERDRAKAADAYLDLARIAALQSGPLVQLELAKAKGPATCREGRLKLLV